MTHNDYIFLDALVAVAICDDLGAVYQKKEDLFLQLPGVPRSLLSNSTTLDFELEGFTFRVPISGFVRHDGTSPVPDQHRDSCHLLILAQVEGVYSTLSASAMRQLYTMYDPSSNIISVALTDFNSTEDNIVQITTRGIEALDGFGSSESTSSEGDDLAILVYELGSSDATRVGLSHNDQAAMSELDSPHGKSEISAGHIVSRKPLCASLLFIR